MSDKGQFKTIIIDSMAGMLEKGEVVLPTRLTPLERETMQPGLLQNFEEGRQLRMVQILKSWERVTNTLEKLDRKLHVRDFSKDVIFAVSRGGLVPAVMLACKIGIPQIDTINVSFYSDHGPRETPLTKKWPYAGDWHADQPFKGLIVDEICDSGQTLKLCKERYPEATTVALYVKEGAKDIPDVYGDVSDSVNWTTFPWELRSW